MALLVTMRWTYIDLSELLPRLYGMRDHGVSLAQRSSGIGA